jgi:hypothetical protein
MSIWRPDMSIEMEGQMLDCYWIVDSRLLMAGTRLIFSSLLDKQQAMPDRLLKDIN